MTGHRRNALGATDSRIILQVIYQALGQTDSADRLLTAPCSARSLTMWRWMTFG